MRRGEAHLRAGHYLDAALVLGSVVTMPGLEAALRTRAYHLQCTAQVALGRMQAAQGAARRVLLLQPGFKPEPVLDSPKVRAVYDRVRKAGN